MAQLIRVETVEVKGGCPLGTALVLSNSVNSAAAFGKRQISNIVGLADFRVDDLGHINAPFADEPALVFLYTQKTGMAI